MENNVVLIADDDKEIVKLIADTLEDEGFKVIKAYNGTEVMEFIQKKEQVDLVLLDIMMPGMDGIEVCKKNQGYLFRPYSFSKCQKPGNRQGHRIGIRCR